MATFKHLAYNLRTAVIVCMTDVYQEKTIVYAHCKRGQKSIYLTGWVDYINKHYLNLFKVFINLVVLRPKHF